ncbi:MAG: FAD-dependent monooxygenase [Candidatus Binatus sp.]|uniref:FAD-dependent monooxygenase n=1 Tax=Candidatus Binatus sp. TaxID=2811406 RepID=UPI003BAF7072
MLIVGAGIGGLTLGLAARHRGLLVDVVERAGSFNPVGAGIGLAANALACLDLLGLREEILASGHQFELARVTDDRGREINSTEFADLGLKILGVAMHRAVLHNLLLRNAEGIEIRLGTTVDSVDISADLLSVFFSDGSRGNYDVVVGCDGVHSRVRRLLFNAREPKYVGYFSWRTIVQRPRAVECPIEMWGRGRRLGLVPISEDELYCFTTLNGPPVGRDSSGDPPEKRVARFHSEFRNFRGSAPAVLEQVVEAAQLVPTDLENVVLSSWVKGRVALLGDAAHAMTPNLGQGAAMAIEDAIVLARLLAENRSVEEAFGRYQSIRFKRVNLMQRRSRLFGVMAQFEASIACAIRDTALRLVPLNLGKRKAVYEMMKVVEAEKARAQHSTAIPA